MARSFRELRQQSKRMKIGDHVYLITDRLQTGAGVPVMICALQDSTVEVFVEFTHEPKILKVSNRGDILSSNLYAHSILNLVYQTYGEIEHKYGSILNLPTEEIVAQLLRRGLAPQTARHCVDLFAEVEWHNAPLPLRQWLESIRDFYHPLRPVQNPSHRRRRFAPLCLKRSRFSPRLAVTLICRHREEPVPWIQLIACQSADLFLGYWDRFKSVTISLADACLEEN